MRKITIALIVAGTFIFSAWYRMGFAQLYPHQPIADEIAYLKVAETLRTNWLFAECCTRGYVYPTLLNAVFAISKGENLSYVAYVQALLDSMTAVLLFLLVTRIFRNTVLGVMACILYAINPLTAGYTGLILTEISTLFFLTLSICLLVYSERWWQFILSGAVLSLAMFDRLMLFYFGLGWMGLFIIVTLVHKKNILSQCIPFIGGIVIGMVYPVIANWNTYHYLSPMPYVPAGWFDFFVSLKVPRWPSLLDEYYEQLDPVLATGEFDMDFGNKELFVRVKDERLTKFYHDFSQNPWPFIVQRIHNIPRFWNKGNLFYFYDPFFPASRPLVSSFNWIYLFCSLVGIIIAFGNKTKSYNVHLMIWYATSMVGYLSFALLMRVPEERHTLPAYPLLVPFFVVAISQIISKIYIQITKHVA